jgi:GNAT superfamily N-acetyltransferase
VKRPLGDGFELDDDPARLDRGAIHAYLGGESYWAGGRTRERQDELIEASARVVGLYYDGRQVGFARAVDCDAAGFMYLADVYVLAEVRGRGLGLELVKEIVENGPDADRRWILHTRDAHALYERLGFGPNERLMERGIPPDGVGHVQVSDTNES